MPPSLILAIAISDDGPIPGADLRKSTWSLVSHLAGPSVPATFELAQDGPSGELGVDGSLTPRIGSTYALVVQSLPATGFFHLTHDVLTGTRSFAAPIDASSWRFELGATVALADLQQAAGGW